MKDFYDEAEMASITCGEEAKREELAKSRKRQQAWVDREDCDSGVKANTWRAPKKARSSSYNLMRYMDNQAP